MLLALASLVLSASIATTLRASADESDVRALLDGVSQIAAPGWPGCLSVYGDQAFAVVAGKANGQAASPVVAAARHERGRIVALGHNGYFGQEALATGDTGRFMANAVRWLAAGRSGHQTATRVAVQGLGDFLALMQQSGIAAENLESADWTAKLSGYNVLVTTAAPAYTAGEVAAVSAFIRNGGGFLSGDTPWGWLQLNPGKSLTADHGGNQLIAPAGLVWADGGLDRTSELGFAAGQTPADLVHAGRALTAVTGQADDRKLSKEELAQATWSITQAARSVLPDDQIILPRLREMEQQHSAEAVPGPDQPLKLDQPLARLALTLQMEQVQRAPAGAVRAHPAADLFPGAVPADAPRVAKTLAINTAVPAWHSTGLYAAPGEVITVTLPQEAADQGLQVHIGCHTDGLWGLDTWKRCPEIVRWFGLSETVTRAANAFGGPVYIDVPEGCKLGQVPVEISGAVAAPYFVLGQTDPRQWQTIRDAPAPWAELQCSSIILSVPSSTIRHLDAPVQLMEFWSHIGDSCQELLSRPLARPRPERYVADVQISAGYMHSGYPIMTHLDGADLAVDLPKLISQGSWGHFHEIGHNHQSGDWTFGGTGEVTVNLFSLYLTDRCCGLRDVAHPAIKPEDRDQRTREHLAAGAEFGKWQSDPFLALYMYMQLQEAFGWDAYKRVFAAYDALPDAARPKTDDEKRDQWLVRFSRTVGRNLGPFFEAWGVPTSPAARDSLTDLPGWMPAGFPPPPV
jgi:hypothetical protein